MRRAGPALWSVAACALALEACGASTKPATKTFAEPGFAIHFTYPVKLQRARSVSVSTHTGNAAGVSKVGLAIAPYDLIVIIRRPGLQVPVSRQNISQARSDFDQLFTATFRRPLTGRATTVGGLPALAYPPTPSPGPSGTTARVTVVFVANVEYELNCQYTPKGRATIMQACEQMLATLHHT